VIHPRISVSAICSYRQTLDEDLALWDRLGVRRIGLTLAKLEAAGVDPAVRRIRDAGLDVTNVIAFGPRLYEPETWASHVERLLAAVAAARDVDASCLGLTTGPAGPLSWEDAADRLEEFLAPVLKSADGLPIIIEHTNSLRVDVGFVHTLRDMVDLARRLGVGVLCETNACWAERGLTDTLRDGIDVIDLVQVSDFVIGTHDTPNRVVPGDGDIPLARVLGDLVGAGYDGVFDLELIGPRIEAEGYESVVRRSLAALTALLTQASAM
jgi:sugar phosphate isomerase/epimerase